MEKLKLNIQLFGGSLSITASETDVSIENNQSYINLTIKATTNSTTYNDSAYLKSASIVGQNNTYSLGRINFSIGKGKTVTVYSGRIGPFDHNADGSLNNVSISASCYIVSNTQPTASASVPMSTIPRASSFTITGGTIGQTLTVNINRASSDFTHEVRVTYGSKTQVISLNAGTSASATLDMDFCNQMPNATTAQGIVSVATKNGSTYIGDTQNQLFTMTVPNSVVPSISSVTKSDTANLVGTYGAYVQGKSDLRIQTSASGSYSSSITNYTINIKDSNNNILRQLGGNDVTLYDISYTGTLTIEAIVTDSRGRQASNTSQISVVEYYNPKINYFTAERRNNDSTVTLTWNAEILNVNSANVNGKTFNIYKRQKGTSSWGNPIETYTSSYTYENNNYTLSCDENYGWEFGLDAIDSFTISTKLAEVGTAFELMNWKADGTAMAIGKVSEKSNTLEVGINTEINGLTTINTPDNTWSGLRINAGPIGESSIVFYNYAQDKSYALGYNTANNDKIGLYSFETGKNVFEIDKYGNTTISGGIQYKGFYFTSGDANDYKNYTSCFAILNHNSSFSNVPTIDANGDDVGFLNVYCWAGNSDWTTQEYIIAKANKTYKYIRRKIPQGWSAWERIYKATTVWEGETNNTISNLPYTLTVFDFIEIFYTDEVGRIGGSLRFKPVDGSAICLTLTETESGSIYIKSGHWKTNGNSFEKINSSFTQISHSNYTGGNNDPDWIHIRKIIGWN